MTARRRNPGARHRAAVTIPGDAGEITLAGPSGTRVRVADAAHAQTLIRIGYTMPATTEGGSNDNPGDPSPTG